MNRIESAKLLVLYIPQTADGGCHVAAEESAVRRHSYKNLRKQRMPRRSGSVRRLTTPGLRGARV